MRSATRISRLLARTWFVETIGVERKLGDGGYGPVFATSVDVRGAVDHGSKEVLTPTGDTAISTARVFLPVETPDVPLGSRVTLPAGRGGGTYEVLAALVHSSGGAQATPDHVELQLQ